MEDNTRPIPIVPWGNQEPLQPLKSATLKATPSKRIQVRHLEFTLELRIHSGARRAEEKLREAGTGPLRLVRILLRTQLTYSKEGERKMNRLYYFSYSQLNFNKSFMFT